MQRSFTRNLCYGAVFFLFLSATASSQVHGAVERLVKGRVLYTHAERLFLDLGRVDGIENGTQIEVVVSGRVVATLEVEVVAEHSSGARFIRKRRVPRPGDLVRAIRVEIPTEETIPETPTPTASSEQFRQMVSSRPLHKIQYKGRRPIPALRRVRSSAYLRGLAWVYFDSAGSGLYQRDRLDLAISAPLDEAGRWWLDADLTAVGQPTAPAGARFRSKDKAWLEVYRATLGYAGSEGLLLGAGRMRQGGMRYGLMDGLTAGWRWRDGPSLQLRAGVRPDLLDLDPSWNQAVAGIDLDGLASLQWGSVRYALNAGWLGEQSGRTQAFESSAHVGVDLRGRFWLDVQAEALAVEPPGGGDTKIVLGSGLLSSMLRLGREVVLRASLRRRQELTLRSDKLLLPATYHRPGVGYDTLAGLHGNLVSRPTWAVDGNVNGGAAIDDGSLGTRYWLSPETILRISRGRGYRVRAAIRYEGGPVGGWIASLGVGAELLDGMFLDLLQQSGVRTFEVADQTLIDNSSWLRLSYRLGAHLEIAVRARALYGEVGNGMEGELRIAGHDLL